MQFCSSEIKDQMEIYPERIDTRNPKLLIIDNKIFGFLIVVNYNKEMDAGFFNKIFSLKANLQLSIFYEKQKPSEVYKKLTYNIGSVASEIRTAGDNKIDSDVVSTTYNDAKYIKSKMQVDGEDLYYIYACIGICASSKEELEKTLQNIESRLNGAGVITRRATYRQFDVLKACMPILKISSELKKISKRNVLSSGIVATYPFFTEDLYDENGILVGTNTENASMVMIDRFNSEKYKNANMCVLGTSGSR